MPVAADELDLDAAAVLDARLDLREQSAGRRLGQSAAERRGRRTGRLPGGAPRRSSRPGTAPASTRWPRRAGAARRARCPAACCRSFACQIRMNSSGQRDEARLAVAPARPGTAGSTAIVAAAVEPGSRTASSRATCRASVPPPVALTAPATQQLSDEHDHQAGDRERRPAGRAAGLDAEWRGSAAGRRRRDGVDGRRRW